MFSIVKVARDQTKPGSLLARPRGQLDERPWERGWVLGRESSSWDELGMCCDNVKPEN